MHPLIAATPHAHLPNDGREHGKMNRGEIYPGMHGAPLSYIAHARTNPWGNLHEVNLVLAVARTLARVV